MNIESFSGRSGLSSLKPRWEELLRLSGSPHAFFDWEWLSLWHEYYGDGCEPLLICASLPGQGIVAAAPLAIRSRAMYGLRLRSVEFLGSGEVTPDHLCFVSSPHTRREFSRLVFRDLASRRREWDLVHLADMADDPAVFESAREVFGAQRCVRSLKGVCPYTPLPGSWQEYTRTLTSGRRQRIGKYERDLRKEFDPHFSLCEREDELVPLMRVLEELYCARMRGKNPRSPALRHGFWEFQQRFARSMLAAGRLFLGSLRLDGETAACMYGFTAGLTVNFYLSAINIRYEKYSVGFVNIVNMIREAIARGFREIDFLRGEEAYKSYFAKSSRDNTELVIWNSTPRAALANAVDAPLSLTKKALKWTRSKFFT